jgi:ribosomal protein S18 acetylase RimI-like enzyme
MTEWSNLQRENFLRVQFAAQHNYYLQHYTNAFFWIIFKNDKPIGRLYLHQKFGDNSVRIIDITLLPEWRNKGIGKSILRQVLDFAARSKQAVSLHVEALNPAMQLYRRMGFEVVGTNNLHYLMKWDNN